MNSTRSIILVVVLAVVAVLVQQSVFVIDPTKQAIVLRFGAVAGSPRVEPGLYFRWPFIDEVKRIEKRLLDYEAREFEIIAGDQKRLVVDPFARYRIVDPLRFYQTTSNNEAVFRAQLDQIIESSVRRELASVPLSVVLTEQRTRLMQEITEIVRAQTKTQYGVEVIDVRIKRADLPAANSQAVFNRMRTQREQEARQLRAEGDEESQRIRATADRERVVIVSEARRKAETLRGEGDAQAIKIYADAFSRDPKFFSFYRSMEAYRQALGSGGTTMVLSPDSDFFRYFGNPSGEPAPLRQ
jgi:membrane protease subunit HflC